jgi:hypothetical protein
MLLFFLSACAKGSCRIELYDFWHSNPPRAPATPSWIQLDQRQKAPASPPLTPEEEDDDEPVCENCIRKIVKSLVVSPGSAEAGGEAVGPTAASPDSVCLLPDMK